MLSVEEKIEKSIKSKQRGVLLFTDDFYELGSNKAILKALERLTNKRVLTRVARGIYVRPIISEFIGEVLPTAEEVAQGIAKRDKIKIIPTGTHAMNLLGLSTQIPLKLVYLTDGAPREIQIGNRTIKLKKTTPKNLLAKGKTSRLVIQALRELGQHGVTEELENKVIELLKSEVHKDLENDITLAPEWIRKIMRKAQ
jgi:predicted transcriptional regulator of viral defense system